MMTLLISIVHTIKKVFVCLHDCCWLVHRFYFYTHLLCYRLTITASCPMDLQYFPMDRQLCYMEIESCKYTL